MDWIFDNERPIYIQLIEQLELRILSGVYPMNERLPSVRELAEEAKVNPNTMQRALQDLESEGLVYTQRTSGRYVTEDKQVLEQARESLAQETVDHFLSSMYRLGFTKKTVIAYLKQSEKEDHYVD